MIGYIYIEATCRTYTKVLIAYTERKEVRDIERINKCYWKLISYCTSFCELLNVCQFKRILTTDRSVDIFCSVRAIPITTIVLCLFNPSMSREHPLGDLKFWIGGTNKKYPQPLLELYDTYNHYNGMLPYTLQDGTTVINPSPPPSFEVIVQA